MSEGTDMSDNLIATLRQAGHDYTDAAADEIEKLRAALTIPKRTLELFERVASKMVSEGYAQGYREACNHIMDKLGEKK